MKFETQYSNRPLRLSNSNFSENQLVPNQSVPLKYVVLDALSGRAVQQVDGSYMSNEFDVNFDTPDLNKYDFRHLTEKDIKDLFPDPEPEETQE